MLGWVAFHFSTTLSILGTQVQKESSTFSSGLGVPLPLLSLLHAAANMVKPSSSTVTPAQRRCPPRAVLPNRMRDLRLVFMVIMSTVLHGCERSQFYPTRCAR